MMRQREEEMEKRAREMERKEEELKLRESMITRLMVVGAAGVSEE